MAEESWKPAVVALQAMREHKRKEPKKDAFKLCTGVYRSIYGFPCKHQVLNILKGARQGILLPKDFHPHWHINRKLLEVLQLPSSGAIKPATTPYACTLFTSYNESLMLLPILHIRTQRSGQVVTSVD
jgi:hypothetical protein